MSRLFMYLQMFLGHIFVLKKLQKKVCPHLVGASCVLLAKISRSGPLWTGLKFSLCTNTHFHCLSRPDQTLETMEKVQQLMFTLIVVIYTVQIQKIVQKAVF